MIPRPQALPGGTRPRFPQELRTCSDKKSVSSSGQNTAVVSARPQTVVLHLPGDISHYRHIQLFAILTLYLMSRLTNTNVAVSSEYPTYGTSSALPLDF